MRVLVEILHPAHVHVFRHAIATWRARGDEVLVLSREKECANDLLAAYGIPFRSISRLPDNKPGLFLEMAIRDLRMLKASLRFKPDVLVGIMGVTIAQVGKVIRKPAIVFYDTENAGITNRVVYPLAHSVATPACYQGDVNGNHVTYPGYHELAYLHPDRFTPDPEVVRAGGLDPDSPYFILRFVSWGASHDIGEEGMTPAFMRKLVERLQREGRVLITSEAELPPDLKELRFRLPVEQMHHFVAFASMLIGESATMASEAAVLGVPAVFISDTGRGYTDEEESRWQLVANFKRDQAEAAFDQVEAWLALEDRAGEFQRRRQAMLETCVDTTTWMVDYVDRVVAGDA